MSAFGKKLFELRQEKGIGQVELAKALNVSKGMISFWENGRSEPTASNIIAVAKFFDVTTDFLLGIED